MTGQTGIYDKFIKRLLDLILSGLALVLLSPLLLILTIVGALAMRGNPFFVQKRPGRIDPKTGKERIFSLVKFRSMDSRKGADGKLLQDEVRLNRYGRFLRAASLDELPELWNIFKGDMSIVGPRPLLVKYLPRYNPRQRHRHDVRPGLTGWAQVHGRNLCSWEDKFEYDVWYAQNVSFAVDVKTILLTIKAVLCREGISAEGSATMEEFMGTYAKAGTYE